MLGVFKLFLKLAVILGRLCGSYFIFFMLYQENECIAHLTVYFPNLEISKPAKKHRNVMGISILALFHRFQRTEAKK